MKNLIYLFTAFCLISFAGLSCESTPQTKTPAVEEKSDAVAPPSTKTISGFVKSMKTKQGLSGVNITIGGQSQTSGRNGAFSFNYTIGSTLSASYSKSGYESLSQDYSDFRRVDQITVYLEEATTTNKSNKSIRGHVFKSNPNPGSPIAVKNIKVNALVSGRPQSSTTTNKDGYYILNFSNSTPTFEYQYKIIGNNFIEEAKINQRSNIKDSTDVDVIFNETVGGVNVDTLR